MTAARARDPELGLRANAAQFTLLVLVNALVGATIGLERSILPALAEQEFGLVARTATLSFIVVFGVSKALTNYFAGRLADRVGRKAVLVGGWLVALPFPLLLIAAPSWEWVLLANLFLGVSQGLTWSTTVVMKIDLAGPAQRGLAMGLNEFAGYLAVAVSALATGALAEATNLRPEPFYLGIAFIAIGLLSSLVLVRETRHHVALEASRHVGGEAALSQREVFARATWKDPSLSAVTWAGLANNLNDGMAWGLFPVLYAGAGLDLATIGSLAAIYPAVQGIGQLFTGGLSDLWGRKGLVVAGMWVQAVGIGVVVLSAEVPGFALGNALLGLGTAMVYPTLIAAIGDVAHPTWRASAVGVYRLWRDLGYAIGALVAGLVADALGLDPAIWLVAAVTFAAGVVVLVRMTDRSPDTGGQGVSATLNTPSRWWAKRS